MDIKTLPDLLRRRVNQTPNAIAHWTLSDNNRWQSTTWAEYGQKVEALACFLTELGLEAGDNIAIMAPPEQMWDFFQLAILMAGGIVVGIDPNDLSENINAIALKTRLKGIIIKETSKLLKFPESVQKELRFAVCTGKKLNSNDDQVACPLIELNAHPQDATRNFADKSSPEQAATIIFTSGTTGAPKGIMYTHRQVLLACRSIVATFEDIKEGDRLVCWLPLSNLFQRIINFCAIFVGAQTYYVTDPRRIIETLPSISPHLFIAVPRFYEKLHEGIVEKLGKASWLIRKLSVTALMVGGRYARMHREKIKPSFIDQLVFIFFDRLVLNKIRRILGSNIKYLISGSAPTPLWLLEWFHSIGLLICEAYGISENIIPNTANKPNQYKFGTVGKPLPGNQIKIAEDGELLVRGEGVFSGYYSDITDVSELTSDGFLATGDFVAIDNDGFISILGRKSEIFKTSTGRKIAPIGIESLLCKIPYVEHAVIIGDSRKSIIAILSISASNLYKRMKLPYFNGQPEKDIELERFYNIFRSDIEQQIDDLPSYQKPSGIILTTQPFTVEGKEITSNLKIRRKHIETQFSDKIESLYETLHLKDIAHSDAERIIIKRI